MLANMIVFAKRTMFCKIAIIYLLQYGMKKTLWLIMCIVLVSSCSGDRLVNEKFLDKNYDAKTGVLDLSDMSLRNVPDFGMM